MEDLPPAVRLDLPDWLYAEFSRTVRRRRSRATGSGAQPAGAARPARQFAQGVSARKCWRGCWPTAWWPSLPYSPLGIRLAGKPALSKHPLFIDGSIEVQDEGSQLLGFLLQPRRGEMVADFCAGAGGKTLLLGALMRSQGRLYAFDVAERRLARLKPRLARSGLSNVHPVRIDSERDTRIRRLAGKLDRVLVDAPCSGLGTLRRNPDMKWRQTPASVAELCPAGGDSRRRCQSGEAGRAAGVRHLQPARGRERGRGPGFPGAAPGVRLPARRRRFWPGRRSRLTLASGCGSFRTATGLMPSMRR
jgi:16S rRNA (cytosine967-C5)-methyltransferase